MRWLCACLLLLALPAAAANGKWDRQTSYYEVTFDTVGTLDVLGLDSCNVGISTTGTAYEVCVYLDSGLTRPLRLPDEAGTWGDTCLTETNYYARGFQEQVLYFDVVSGSGAIRVDAPRCH